MNRLSTEKKYDEMSSKELFKIFSEDRSNTTLRNILIEKHLYLAKIISRKYMNKGVDYEDIFQVASLALIYAIDRYDISRGFEFSSFATPTIEGEIKKYFRDKVWTMRVPRRIQELSKKISNAKEYLTQTNNKVPMTSEIAEYLGVTEESVLEAMEASFGYQPISLDTSTGGDDSDDKDMTLGDRIGVEDKEFSRVVEKDFLDNFMTTLNELEIKIMEGRFFHNKTQSVIAKEIGISQMTVSRIEKKIIEKLRKEYKRVI
ncbi:SigB/SigF/SigG family RNA polymerase sigma factor [Peptostreptococcus faecalis]|uniref:SigB/SigF/SigG family RNA polymerase sigma factor n=1 Tax=Peptostreptococcus faecalis TaxID=2045015 RepID=UPI000C7BDA86|nr:SigB/SigF/SigG family RNA polymerase sigma factor [Peptostreptococcus faecalis]